MRPSTSLSSNHCDVTHFRNTFSQTFKSQNADFSKTANLFSLSSSTNKKRNFSSTGNLRSNSRSHKIKASTEYGAFDLNLKLLNQDNLLSDDNIASYIPMQPKAGPSVDLNKNLNCRPLTAVSYNINKPPFMYKPSKPQKRAKGTAKSLSINTLSAHHITSLENISLKSVKPFVFDFKPLESNQKKAEIKTMSKNLITSLQSLQKNNREHIKSHGSIKGLGMSSEDLTLQLNSHKQLLDKDTNVPPSFAHIPQLGSKSGANQEVPTSDKRESIIKLKKLTRTISQTNQGKYPIPIRPERLEQNLNKDYQTRQKDDTSLLIIPSYSRKDYSPLRSFTTDFRIKALQKASRPIGSIGIRTLMSEASSEGSTFQEYVEKYT